MTYEEFTALAQRRISIDEYSEIVKPVYDYHPAIPNKKDRRKAVRHVRLASFPRYERDCRLRRAACKRAKQDPDRNGRLAREVRRDREHRERNVNGDTDCKSEK